MRTMPVLSHSDRDRFLTKVCKSDFSAAECWVWTAACDRYGYGQFAVAGRRLGAHRVSYVLHFGEIPAGLWVLHRCDNPRCVNPGHLFLGTAKDNTRDAMQKGRLPQIELIRRGSPRPTHCKRGHELSGANVIHRNDGLRRCRTCLDAYEIGRRGPGGSRESKRARRSRSEATVVG